MEELMLSRLENPANSYIRHTEQGTAVSDLLGLISSTHHYLHHWRSNQKPQQVETETLPVGHRFKSHISDTYMYL